MNLVLLGGKVLIPKIKCFSCGEVFSTYRQSKSLKSLQQMAIKFKNLNSGGGLHLNFLMIQSNEFKEFNGFLYIFFTKNIEVSNFMVFVFSEFNESADPHWRRACETNQEPRASKLHSSSS